MPGKIRQDAAEGFPIGTSGRRSPNGQFKRFYSAYFFSRRFHLSFICYLLSYIPFSDGTDGGLLGQMWRNQQYMLSYHSTYERTHPYASAWYQWPLMIRPVFYYSNVLDDTMRQGISAFGNPLVWWAGIPAFFYMLYLWVRKKDAGAAFLCTAYCACYLPWCLVSRSTFAYHYFPCVPFVCCMIMYSFAQWKKGTESKGRTRLAAGYGILALALFVMFYPVISGLPVSENYVSHMLRWLDTWVLVL